MQLDSHVLEAHTPADWLRPRFSAVNVRSLMTTRDGGVSAAPFDRMNLRDGLGDDPQAVRENRRRWQAATGVRTCLLDQVHGADVVRLDAAAWPTAAHELPHADASFTDAVGVGCEIQVADCLPVLFAHRDGRVVGAAHAGWRGLAGGVLEATLARMCEAGACRPDEIEAWLGPCIGATHFEVGDDVRRAFQGEAGPAERPEAASGNGRDASVRFLPHAPGKWLADLPGLARDRLRAAGVVSIDGNDGSLAWCTYANASRFFSFRRDRLTGRMAACIWRLG